MATPERVRRRDRLAAARVAPADRRAGAGAGPAPLGVRRRRAGRSSASSSAHEAIAFDRFSARRERSAEGDRLSVSLRLRTTMNVSLPCYVFLVARNDQVTPKQWAIWPPQPPGPAITAGGHFHGATPTTGFAVTLSDQWERINATVPQPNGGDAIRDRGRVRRRCRRTHSAVAAVSGVRTLRRCCVQRPSVHALPSPARLRACVVRRDHAERCNAETWKRRQR